MPPPVRALCRSVLLFFLVFASTVLPLSAQTTMAREGHLGVGIGSSIPPVITGAVDWVHSSGALVGAGTSTAFHLSGGPWWLLVANVRAGLQGRMPRSHAPRTQPFILGEIGFSHESSCCGFSPAAGVSAGVTRWFTPSRGVRVEGRLLVPLRSQGGLFLVQLSLALR